MEADSIDWSNSDFYAVLGLSRSATLGQIKKRYRYLALKVHPDRNVDHPEQSKERFQILNRIWTTLGNTEKRKLYDELGVVADDMGACDTSTEWETYFNTLFSRVGVREIKAFEKKYKNSLMEREDLVEAYDSARGNMEDVMMSVPLSTDEDEDRFRCILQGLIDAGELELHPDFVGESPKAAKLRRKRSRATQKREEKEAEKYAEELNLDWGNDDSLAHAILSRRRSQDDILAALEAKYAPPPKKNKKNKKTKSPYDIPDDEFERIQAGLAGGNNKKVAKAKAKKMKKETKART